MFYGACKPLFVAFLRAVTPRFLCGIPLLLLFFTREQLLFTAKPRGFLRCLKSDASLLITSYQTDAPARLHLLWTTIRKSGAGSKRAHKEANVVSVSVCWALARRDVRSPNIAHVAKVTFCQQLMDRMGALYFCRILGQGFCRPFLATLLKVQLLGFSLEVSSDRCEQHGSTAAPLPWLVHWPMALWQ